MKATAKRIEELLREQAATAHEAALRQALQALSLAFKDWERGVLDSAELSRRIERFLDHARHDLPLRYRSSQLSMPVAHAIATGVVDRSTVPAELLDHLAGAIEFYASESPAAGVATASAAAP